MHPRCLVLDEPTAMLDPVGRAEVLDAVCRLHREEGITVVYITHFMEEAVAAGRVVVMDAGRVILDGLPGDVFQDVDRIRDLGLDVPVSADVAAQLRRRGMNLPGGITTNEGLAKALCL